MWWRRNLVPGQETHLRDVCFSYVWARVLLRLQDYMEQHGLADHYPVMPQLNLFGTLGASDDAGEQATFIGPTWMDDTAICLSSPSAAALISKATQTAGRLLELCVEHGMTPNLKRGKSEILLSLRGPKISTPQNCALWTNSYIDSADSH